MSLLAPVVGFLRSLFCIRGDAHNNVLRTEPQSGPALTSATPEQASNLTHPTATTPPPLSLPGPRLPLPNAGHDNNGLPELPHLGQYASRGDSSAASTKESLVSSTTTLRRGRPMVSHNSPRPSSAYDAIRHTIEGAHSRHPLSLPQPDTPLGPYTQCLLEKRARAELESLHRVAEAFCDMMDEEEFFEDAKPPAADDTHLGEAPQPTSVELHSADDAAAAAQEEQPGFIEHEDIHESPTPPTSTPTSRASSKAKSLLRSLTRGRQMSERPSMTAQV